jgi:predicted kinase
MDLEKRGLRRLANRTLNRWLDRTGDDDALALLPLFLSQRASVRAKVVAAGADAAPEGEQAGRRAEAAAYLDLALAYLDPPPARLVAVGGWSGTGKTTLARALAPDIGPAPGAIVIRSDVIRKTLAGVGETERLPAAAYTKDASAAVYTALEARAARVLAAGHGAIADAVFGMEEERSAIEAVARHAATRFDGLWLEVPLAVATARVAARRGDASDADAAVVERQHKNETGPIAWPTVDASGSAETVAARASAMLMPA